MTDEEVINQLIEENQELIEKLHFILDWADKAGYLEDHTFTFPDGDTWYTY